MPKYDVKFKQVEYFYQTHTIEADSEEAVRVLAQEMVDDCEIEIDDDADYSHCDVEIEEVILHEETTGVEPPFPYSTPSADAVVDASLLERLGFAPDEKTAAWDRFGEAGWLQVVLDGNTSEWHLFGQRLVDGPKTYAQLAALLEMIGADIPESMRLS